MAWKVSLRDDEGWWGPLTTNIVGNDDILDPSINVIRKSGSNSIVDIDVPEHNG